MKMALLLRQFDRFAWSKVRNLLVAGLISVISSQVNANPSSKSPDSPLKTHDTIDGAAAMVQQLHQVYLTNAKLVAELDVKNGDPRGVSARKVQDGMVQIWKGARISRHLKTMGEPAGFDYAMRMEALRVSLGNHSYSFESTRDWQKLREKHGKKLVSGLPKLQKFVGQARAALEQGKIDVFIEQMEVRGEELMRDTCPFRRTEWKKYSAGFFELLAAGDSEMEKLRRKRYAEVATKKAADQLQLAIQFDAKASDLIQQVRAAGSARLEEGKMIGPLESFDHLANLWTNASAGIIRAHVLRVALVRKSDQEMVPKMQQLKSLGVAKVAEMVEAIGQSVSPAEAPNTYAKLLTRISTLQRRIGENSGELVEACEPKLMEFADKSPAIKRAGRNYELATKQPLLWHQRFAEARGKTIAPEFPLATSLLETEVAPDQQVLPSFQCRLRPPKLATTKTLSYPPAWLVRQATEVLVGKPTRGSGMLRLSPKTSVGVVPYQQHHYMNVAISPSSNPAMGSLKSALLVSDEHPPLTLTAANAIGATKMRDSVAMGGVIKGVHLEGLVTRFITLPNAAYLLQPLGELPSFDPQADILASLCWRLDIEPIWMMHRYAFQP